MGLGFVREGLVFFSSGQKGPMPGEIQEGATKKEKKKCEDCAKTKRKVQKIKKLHANPA